MSQLTKQQSASDRNMMRYWIRQESTSLRMIIYVLAFTLCLFGIPNASLHNRLTPAGVIVRIAVPLVVIALFPRLLGTKFAVKHSAIGRQLQRFGDFDTVYADVCAAAQSPLYTNGTEVISGKYIFLMTEPANAVQTPTFGNAGKLLILSVNELERVSIKPNTLYSDEMNTVLFRTNRPIAGALTGGNLFTMTVHMDTAATEELVAAIAANMHTQKEAAEQADYAKPFPRRQTAAHTKDFSDEQAAARTQEFAYQQTDRANSYPYKSTRSPAARSAARFRSNPLRELLAGKLRVFRLIIFFIIFANVGTPLLVYFITDNHTLSTLPRDFVRFIRIARNDLIADPGNLALFLGLLACYIIPLTLIYIMIRRWYRRFLREYEKLPHQEQETLLAQLCDNFETGQPAVIFTEHCFCFRNIRMLKFQTLLPYTSVLWIYRSHSQFELGNMSPSPFSTQVDFQGLVIRTADRRKYRLSTSAESTLHRRVPDAVIGYGDVQRETYLDKIRARKNER